MSPVAMRLRWKLGGASTAVLAEDVGIGVARLGGGEGLPPVVLASAPHAATVNVRMSATVKVPLRTHKRMTPPWQTLEVPPIALPADGDSMRPLIVRISSCVGRRERRAC